MQLEFKSTKLFTSTSSRGYSSSLMQKPNFESTHGGDAMGLQN
jgi:hypothetical protein